METPTSPQGELAGRYHKLAARRQPYLDRGEKCSALTIPSLLPPKGASYTTQLKDPFQSIGSQGTNNLASKLLLALLPPNQPCFRFSVDEAEFERLSQELAGVGMNFSLTKADLESSFGRLERQIIRELETRATRVPAYQVFQYLIVLGNALLFIPQTGQDRVYRMDSYVCRRDPDGQPREIIIRELLTWEEMDDSIRALVPHPADPTKPDNRPAELFTRILLVKEQWKVSQEIEGKSIPLAPGFRGYPKDKCPWLPLSLNRIDGEHYGRGFIEQYLGDLESLESLTRSIVEASAASAKILFMVKPNAGGILPKKLAEAENGDFVAGNKDDVGTLQVEKQADLRVALETIEKIETRLSRAFLLNSAVQRNAERVTAEEIRYVAGELEDALGGVYSILTVEFQLPLIKRIIYTMVRRGLFPNLPEKLVYPVIVTGIEALGRNADLNKLRLFMQTLRDFLPEQVIEAYIKAPGIIKAVGTATNQDTTDIIRTEDEVQQNQGNQQMMQMAQQVAPTVADAALNQQPQPQGQG